MVPTSTRAVMVPPPGPPRRLLATVLRGVRDQPPARPSSARQPTPPAPWRRRAINPRGSAATPPQPKPLQGGIMQRAIIPRGSVAVELPRFIFINVKKKALQVKKTRSIFVLP